MEGMEVLVGITFSSMFTVNVCVVTLFTLPLTSYVAYRGGGFVRVRKRRLCDRCARVVSVIKLDAVICLLRLGYWRVIDLGWQLP